MFRKCSGNVPVMFREMLPFCSGNVPGNASGLFQERSLGLFQERSLGLLFLEHAHKLPRTIKGEAYDMSIGAKAYRKRTGRCFCVISRYHLVPSPLLQHEKAKFGYASPWGRALRVWVCANESPADSAHFSLRVSSEAFLPRGELP